MGVLKKRSGKGPPLVLQRTIVEEEEGEECHLEFPRDDTHFHGVFSKLNYASICQGAVL